MQTNSKYDIGVYKLYKNKYLNSDKIKFNLEQPQKDALIITDDLKNQIGELFVSDDGYLSGLWILPEYQHSLTSKRALNMLFDKANQIALKNDADELSLEVFNSNTRAIKGYIDKQNFKVENFDLHKVCQKLFRPVKDNILTPEQIAKREEETKLLRMYTELERASVEDIIDCICYNITDVSEDFISKEAVEFLKKYRKAH